MTDETKPPPDAYSAFKAFLEKLVKVPKKEIDRKEAEGLTAIASDPNEPALGPIVVQGDHGSVEFQSSH